MEFKRETFRPFFQWRFTGVWIPCVFPLGVAIIALPDTNSNWPFILAYALFSLTFILAVGAWLTSDYLHKLNPVTWGKSRQQRITVWDINKFVVFRWGGLLAILLIFVVSMVATDSFRTGSINRFLSSPKGYLMPANETSPPDACPPNLKAFKVHYGANVGFAVKFPYAILTINEERKILLERNDKGGLAITLDVFDQRNFIVAEIVKNEFTVNVNNAFKIVRPDRNSLIVVNQQKEQVLNVRYLNGSSIKISGAFFYPKIGTILITDDAVYVGDRVIRGNCTDNSGGAINISTTPPPADR